MKPTLFSSRVSTDAIELERLLVKNRLTKEVNILYLGEDFTHSQIPLTKDYYGNLGHYIPTFMNNGLCNGNPLAIIESIKQIVKARKIDNDKLKNDHLKEVTVSNHH
jgi:hypothetical protein